LDQPHLSRIAIAFAWEELRERPLRLGPSPTAINNACERVEHLDHALADYARELQATEARQATLTCDLTRLETDERTDALVESNSLVFALARLQHEIATVSNLLDRARRDL